MWPHHNAIFVRIILIEKSLDMYSILASIDEFTGEIVVELSLKSLAVDISN